VTPSNQATDVIIEEIAQAKAKWMEQYPNERHYLLQTIVVRGHTPATEKSYLTHIADTKGEEEREEVNDEIQGGFADSLESNVEAPSPPKFPRHLGSGLALAFIQGKKSKPQC
jgi:hypothetical protein